MIVFENGLIAQNKDLIRLVEFWVHFIESRNASAMSTVQNQ